MSANALLTPTKLGDIPLANRIVMAPLTRSRADAHGVPAEFAAKYYAQRASAGLIVTEATQTSFSGMGYPRTPGVHTQAQQARWKQIVDAVHAAGGRIVVQLWHVGRIANALNRGVPAETVAPSAIAAPGQMYTDAQGMAAHDTPRALASDEIPRIAAEFAHAAKQAVDLGFDGVEIHSANGYLLHQFLSSNVNRRTDGYGGSIVNRVRMPLEVVDAVLARVPSGRVGIRVSPGHTFNGIEETDQAELYAHYYGELAKRNLAYLHVMRPFANTAQDDPVTVARGLYRGAIIAAGGYDPVSAEALVASGGAEAIAFGRAFISNPDLVGRIARGRLLAAPDESTFYTPGEKGYTDYPTLAA